MRSELSEAKRRLSNGRTWYVKLLEKNRAEEEKYRQKLTLLEKNVNRLQEEENAK